MLETGERRTLYAMVILFCGCMSQIFIPKPYCTTNSLVFYRFRFTSRLLTGDVQCERNNSQYLNKLAQRKLLRTWYPHICSNNSIIIRSPTTTKSQELRSHPDRKQNCRENERNNRRGVCLGVSSGDGETALSGDDVFGC